MDVTMHSTRFITATRLLSGDFHRYERPQAAAHNGVTITCRKSIQVNSTESLRAADSVHFRECRANNTDNNSLHRPKTATQLRPAEHRRMCTKKLKASNDSKS